MKTKHTFTDPTGPGTAAWIEAERAVSLWLEGRRHAAGCAMARMIAHFKRHDRADAIEGNKAWIYRERLNPSQEY